MLLGMCLPVGQWVQGLHNRWGSASAYAWAHPMGQAGRTDVLDGQTGGTGGRDRHRRTGGTDRRTGAAGGQEGRAGDLAVSIGCAPHLPPRSMLKQTHFGWKAPQKIPKNTKKPKKNDTFSQTNLPPAVFSQSLGWAGWNAVALFHPGLPPHAAWLPTTAVGSLIRRSEGMSCVG